MLPPSVGKEKEQNNTGCLLSIECASTKPGVETLTPRWWYSEVGLWEAIRSWEWAPNEWISALIKEITDSSLASSAIWGHIEKMVICEPGSGPSPEAAHAGTLILDVQSPELWEINVYCL